MSFTKALLVLLLCPSLVWADGIMTPAAAPIGGAVCSPTQICLEDDFTTGGTASGSVGRLGWGFGTGVAAYVAGTSAGSGGIRRNTGVATATAYLMPNSATQDVYGPASMDLEWWITAEVKDANTTIRIGAGYLTNTAPTHGQYFEALDADTNYFCVTRAAGVQTGTRIDTGVAVDTTARHKFRVIRKLSESVRFQIDGVDVCGVMTANIPSNALAPFVHTANSNASADKTIRIHKYKMKWGD